MGGELTREVEIQSGSKRTTNLMRQKVRRGSQREILLVAVKCRTASDRAGRGGGAQTRWRSEGGGARESTVWSSKERPPSYRGGCGRDSTSISCSEVVNRVVTSSRQSFPPCGHCSRVVQERVMSTCVSVYLDN